MKKSWVLGDWRMIPGFLVDCLEGKEPMYFQDKEIFRDFKFYLLSTLYSRRQVFQGSTKFDFLEFVDNIMHKSLRA